MPTFDALLAATLPGPGSPAGEDIPAIVAGGNLATDDRSVMLARPESSEADGRPVADYLTTACVVVLGLGLTTGPIIPDLLRLIPSRSSPMAHRPRRGPCGSSGGSTSRPRAFGDRTRRAPGSAPRRED